MSERVVALDAVFRADRVFIRTASRNGIPLMFWTDSGGGALMSREAVRRLGLVERPRELDGEVYPAAVDAPELEPPFPPIPGILMVDDLPSYCEGADGLLGQAWHADRVWTYDYPHGRLYEGPALAHDGRTVALGFQTDDAGRRTNAFPRIDATVDGETWSFLFDTGATLSLTEEARARLEGEVAPLGGTCFATASLIERWTARHPEWLMVPHADALLGGSLLRVPAVTIAGYEVGPVWFTSRPDQNFHTFMSQWMDTQIHGALGGSLFRYFQIQVDYPKALATFHRDGP